MKILGISRMSFEDMLRCTARSNPDAVISVGTIMNGQTSVSVYGENAEPLPQRQHIYEIGSITKTFTASLLFKAIDEGRISLDDSISRYLDLPADAYYPTIRRIVTHTAGYKGTYREKQMPSGIPKAEKVPALCGLPREMLLERVKMVRLNDRSYPFRYSNFGLSVLGAVLSEVYGMDFPALMTQYIKQDLSLNNTMISDGSGDLGHYWRWAENSAYLPAGSLTSTIEDMLEYARLHMNAAPEYLRETHKKLAKPDAIYSITAKFNVHFDFIGAAWMADEQHGLIWHTGATSFYNSYLGFDPINQLAVVVLSNLPFAARVSSPVMGAALLLELQKKLK